MATWGRWLLWDGKRWRTEETLAATDLIRNVCRQAALSAPNDKTATKLASASTVGGVERLARADRRHAATTGEWDADPWLLNTPGGVLDLRTGQQRLHDRAERMTNLFYPLAPWHHAWRWSRKCLHGSAPARVFGPEWSMWLERIEGQRGHYRLRTRQ